MTVFVADHTGTMEGAPPRLRPIHVGAALAPPHRIGPEPDTTVAGSLSAIEAFADLRLYDYVSKAYAGRCRFVAIQQYRRSFMLGSTRPWQRTLRRLERRIDPITEGQVEISPEEHEALQRHLARVDDETIRLELDHHAFIANPWSFGSVSVEDQYLGSIADLYPGDSSYINAWHDMKAVLGGLLDPALVEETLRSTSGFFNNCFVTTWDEFQLYNGFLFAVLGRLSDYADVYRLYGYLAERIFTVYLAHQIAVRPGFSVLGMPMLVAPQAR